MNEFIKNEFTKNYMSSTFLLLGTNLGNRFENLRQALKLITTNVGEIISSSSVYETEPWGKKEQPPFFNQIISVETSHKSSKLIDVLKNIEKFFGNRIPHSWDARILDIDILYINSQIINNQELNIPHPYIPFRKFTLIPLVEIAPNFIHPVYRLSNAELLASCTDTSTVLSTKQCGEKNDLK